MREIGVLQDGGRSLVVWVPGKAPGRGQEVRLVLRLPTQGKRRRSRSVYGNANLFFERAFSFVHRSILSNLASPDRSRRCVRPSRLLRPHSKRRLLGRCRCAISCPATNGFAVSPAECGPNVLKCSDLILVCLEKRGENDSWIVNLSIMARGHSAGTSKALFDGYTQLGGTFDEFFDAPTVPSRNPPHQ